ncbi:MAG: hypothetical protein IKE74_07305 [Mogibacterium sp.]|nr:hypothetical protein [Mogibacterium sp.]
MIENISASVNKLSDIVPCDKEDPRYRLQIVIFGDDESELKYAMLRMVQAIYPIPPVIRLKEPRS